MNINKQHILGVDVGGSHISAAVVDIDTGRFQAGSYQKIDIDATCKPDEFIHALSNLIVDYTKSTKIKAVGFSFPGPLNYDKGIVQISGLAKYNKLFGLNLKKTLGTIVNQKINYLFENDATCFTIGAYFLSKSKKYSRVLGITLGTGFGSTFLIDGKIQKAIKGVPENGFLYSEKFKSGIADDYFSTRWLIKRFFELSGRETPGGKELNELALLGNQQAKQLFYEFGESLALFLKPHLDGFKPDNLVIGGNIAKAWNFISESFYQNINKDKLKVSISANGEHSAIVGAAMLFMQKGIKPEKIPSNYRQTKQFLAAQKADPAPKGKYDIYPFFPIGNGKIGHGYEGIANWISEKQTVILDGYIGVFWDNIINQLNHYFIKNGLKVFWFDINSALKPATEIDELILPYLGDEDSIFGKRCDKSLSDFFCKDKLNQIATVNESAITIIYGCGASVINRKSPLIYFDLPKNEIQFRSRASQVKNLGSDTFADPKTMYKRFYFVDWPVLNHYKQQILPNIDLLVDEQNPESPVFIKGNDFRNALSEISKNYFRVRPWFEPGAWGGQWMKEKIPGLAQDVPNYAWSFELIVPENGIMLESMGLLLEFSFDFLMYQESKSVLGEAQARFETDFPIRFDFLDTFEGGNLSIQCHPRPGYMKEYFGEDFTQDETYYILDTKDNAEVYLGFQDDIEPDKFRKELEESFRKKKEMDIKKYVQIHPAAKHDLFLIPNGTIHGSGTNNLVLEISSTPYIFTFKMYDWLRLDLDGKPRPINIEHAFKNLYFDYKGQKVKDEFISKPKTIKEGKDWQIVHLPTHPNHFYDVERLEFSNFIEAKTNNQSHIFMLVEGKSLMLETKNGMKQQFNYAETFVVPAAAESYKLINRSKSQIKVIKAFVKGL